MSPISPSSPSGPPTSNGEYPSPSTVNSSQTVQTPKTADMHNVPRPVLSPNYQLGNLQQTYSQLLQGDHVSKPLDPYDLEAMKRALDTSSLPNNPINGSAPHIDPTSSFENIPPKKARHSPITHPPPLPTGPPLNMAAPPSFSPSGRPGNLLGYSPSAAPINLASGHNYSPPSAGPLNLAAAQAYPSSSAQPLNLAGPKPYSPQGYQTHPGYMNHSPNGNHASPINMGGPLGTPTAQTGGPQMPFVGTPMGFNMGYPYMGFNTPSPIMSPTISPHSMTGNYGPAAAAAAVAAAGNTTGRTVYVGSLPPDASVDELLNLVRFGPIEQVRLLPEKSCVFISFLDGSTAAAFHADASVKKLALHGQELKIGWGKPSTLPPVVVQAVTQSQATRNVFVGNLPENINEQDLRDTCSKYGPIDQVKIVRDKNIGFVHFLSIGTAIKVVSQLPLEDGWQDRRVNYGKDRCAYVPKAQQAAVAAAQAQAHAAISSQQAAHAAHAHVQMPASPFGPHFSPMNASFGSPFGTPAASGFASPMFNPAAFNSPGGYGADPSFASQAGNRNIYLGNIHPDTTTEELCNNIRGGVIQQIRHMKDKNIAFVTFADASRAMAFHTHANMTGLTINSRRLKVGWGKHSGPLSPALASALHAGASRNVYVGAITDFETVNEEKLRKDFSEFGEIEMINFLKEKGAAFVNFTAISYAQKAIEGIKSKPEYAALRVSYGKDRCANQPRSISGSTAGPRPSTDRTLSQNDINDELNAKIAAMEQAEEFGTSGVNRSPNAPKLSNGRSPKPDSPQEQ